MAAIDTTNHRLVLMSGGAPVAYERLCIASGSSPNPPPFAGAELSGVMTMRTLQDARTFTEDPRSSRVKRAVVVGGGPLALEWAQGLRARGADVTYVLRGREFMGGVDATGSDLVATRLRAPAHTRRDRHYFIRALDGFYPDGLTGERLLEQMVVSSFGGTATEPVVVP